MRKTSPRWRAAVATAVLACATTAVAGDTALIVLLDRQPYFQGSYGAYASPWSADSEPALLHGRDYADTITIDPLTFPDGTLISTRWPLAKPKKAGVWGYHALSFGNYDGGLPPAAVKPREVRHIRRLRETFAFRYDGSASFNLLNEFYLTSRPGDAAAKVIEVGVLLHAPASSMAFVRAGNRIATFDDGAGRVWLITRTGSYVTIARQDGTDLPHGTIDLKPILALLVRFHVITGREWFNGIAFGTEPTDEAGVTRLHIDHWRVDYD